MIHFGNWYVVLFLAVHIVPCVSCGLKMIDYLVCH